MTGFVWRTQTQTHTSSRMTPSSALSLAPAPSLSIHSSSSGLLKGLRASRWMMRSLKGLWLGGAEVPLRRLNVHCFWTSGAAGGTGLLCNLTHLPVMNAQTEELDWKCVDRSKKKRWEWKVVKFAVKTTPGVSIWRHALPDKSLDTPLSSFSWLLSTQSIHTEDSIAKESILYELRLF